MNTEIQVSFQIKVLSGYMTKSGIAGPHGNFIFRFERNLSMKQRQTHRYSGQTYGCQGVEEREGLEVRS